MMRRPGIIREMKRQRVAQKRANRLDLFISVTGLIFFVIPLGLMVWNGETHGPAPVAWAFLAIVAAGAFISIRDCVLWEMKKHPSQLRGGAYHERRMQHAEGSLKSIIDRE